MRGNSNLAVLRGPPNGMVTPFDPSAASEVSRTIGPQPFRSGVSAGPARTLFGYRDEEARAADCEILSEVRGRHGRTSRLWWHCSSCHSGFSSPWARRNYSALYMVPCLGGIIGSLMGIGQVIIDQFSDEEPDPHEDPRPTWGLLADFYLGAFSPWWMKVINAMGWVAHKDFSEQEPGRWKRGLIAAAACAPHPAFPEWLCRLGEPHAPRSRLFPAPSDAFPVVFRLGGGIAGAWDGFAPRSRTFVPVWAWPPSGTADQ